MEIVKVDLIERGSNSAEHNIALLLRLDDIIASGLSEKKLLLGKESHCR